MKLDLHIHSNYSRDASARPEEILRRCRELGLDGLAVTDHNAIEGSLKAYSMAADEGLVVVRGVEVSAKEGHVLALGVNQLVQKGLSVPETIERIHAAGGLAIVAHPHRFPSGTGVDVARQSKFDAIEILNGGNSRRSNRLARRVAEEMRTPVTGGSDAHELDEVGKAYTVLEDATDEAGVLEAISKGRTQVEGSSRSFSEGVRYSWDTFWEWLRGDMKRL